MKYKKYSCISPNRYVVNFDTQKRRKYDADIIESIRTLVLDGKSTRKIAKEIGIPHSSVYNIMKREGMIKTRDQSKPSLVYLDRAECKAIHEISDSNFDYIRSKYPNYTINRDGKIYIHYLYFEKYKYDKLGYKNNYKNWNKNKGERMSLFNVDDYPLWIVRVADYFGVEDRVTDQSVWDSARESKEYPHIGNIIVNELFSLIAEEIENMCRKLNITVDIKYEANAMGSYITIDGTDYTDGENIVEYLKQLS